MLAELVQAAFDAGVLKPPLTTVELGAGSGLVSLVGGALGLRCAMNLCTGCDCLSTASGIPLDTDYRAKWAVAALLRPSRSPGCPFSGPTWTPTGVCFQRPASPRQQRVPARSSG